MALVLLFMQMDRDMKGIGRWVIHTDTEFLHSLMVLNIMVLGKKENIMVKVNM